MPYKDKEKQQAYNKRKWQKILQQRIAKGISIGIRGIHKSPLKTRTYEQFYGPERSKEIKAKLIERLKNRPITNITGEKVDWNNREECNRYRRKYKKRKRQQIISQKIAKGLPVGSRKGMTFEEYFGKEEADRIREKMRAQKPRNKWCKKINWEDPEEVKSYDKFRDTLRRPKKYATSIKGKTFEEFYGKERSDEIKTKYRANRLKQVIPKIDTSIEVKIQKALTERGMMYSKHYPIKGQPDIAFPEQKIAIFCDGDYWHSLETKRKRDQIVNDYLKEQGWIVLRYWEKEIKKDTKAIVEEIQNELSLALATIPICQ